MIDSLISAVATVLSWIAGLLLDIAGFFGSLASASEGIPLVGDTLANLFRNVRNAFYDLRYDLISFSYRLQNALYAISNWLVDLDDLIGAVYGWISDRIDDAYSWARNAWDWIVDTGQDLWNDVYGWIMDKIDDAYSWASDAWDWIVANAEKVAEIPALIKSEVLAIIGPVFNLVEFWFDDIQLFFTDPSEYFAKKVEEWPASFSERLWAVVERILERIW